MEQRHGQHGAKPVRHLSIQKEEAENTLAHWEWRPEPSTGDSLLQQGSKVQQSESLGLEADCTCMDAVAEGQVLAPQSSLKLPQHGFSRGCDQKKENPDQGCPHLSFL